MDARRISWEVLRMTLIIVLRRSENFAFRFGFDCGALRNSCGGFTSFRIDHCTFTVTQCHHSNAKLHEGYAKHQ
jgi:hypothetical protein